MSFAIFAQYLLKSATFKQEKMKKQLLLLLLLDLCMASSCNNNQDFAYNEKMTSNFYSCKERLDDKHYKLARGGFDSEKEDLTSHEMELRDARNLAEYTNETKNKASTLEHSHEADAFHTNVLTYMSAIADEYTPLLIKYIEEQDTSARKAIRLQLESRRDALHALEDKCQELQIAFLKKAGIKINTESIQQN